MKKLIVKTVLALTFSMLLSSPSYAEWTKVAENANKDVYFVDFDRIRGKKGDVYFWMLSDFPLVPIKGWMSSIEYVQTDCLSFRYKKLQTTFYDRGMGGGPSTAYTPYKDWIYPHPKSVIEKVIGRVCDSVR